MKNLYSLLLVLFGTAAFTHAQKAGQYYFKAGTGASLENISSGATQLLGANADLIVSAPTTFFPFVFAGVSYDKFSVSEDGVVTLGTSPYHPYPYDDYLGQTFGNPASSFVPVFPIIAAWGEDLYTGTDGSVSYKITGTAPARKLVIEFRVRSVEDNTGVFNKTFQVWLSEGSNTIQYVYGDVVSDWYNNANIGIAAGANDYLSVNSATQTVSSTEVASNSDGVYPNFPASLPKKGTQYIFSPVEIVEASSPVTAAIAMFPEYPVARQHRNTIYLGFGVQSVSLQATASGGAPAASDYTYSWSPATGLSSTTVASPVASPKQTTTYTVTVNDGKGHTGTQSITVAVIDPRSGDKFKVCKQGKTTICISKEAVQAQLDNGSGLGDCADAMGQSTVSTSGSSVENMHTFSNEAVTRNAAMSVYPNPSMGSFTVQVPAGWQQATVSVYNAAGNLVAQKRTADNGAAIQFNLSGKMAGVYLVKVASAEGVQSGKLLVR